MTDVGRLVTAMITPFDAQGEVNYAEAKRLASALVDSGSEGLVVTGTTGETPTLSAEERLRLYSEVKSAVGDRAAVIAGTTDNNTAASIELSKLAEREGADALLLTVPAYNKPTQDGLYQHFKSIAESVHLPCILYNVTSRTSLNMSDETTVRLSAVDNIIGVKEAGSDLDQITRIIRDTPDSFRVWSGNDNETFYIVAAGRVWGGQCCLAPRGQPDQGHDRHDSGGRYRERSRRAPPHAGHIQDTVHRLQPHPREVLRWQGRFRRGQSAPAAGTSG